MSEAAAGPGPVTLAASFDGPPGAPVLVLGNSLGTTGSLWHAQLPALRRRYRVLCYEHRGHGGSPAPPGPYTIGGLAADVLGLLDSHGVAAASYAGVSLGGMVGMWLAANAPERIESLVLCCTSAWMPPPEAWRARAAQVRSAGPGSIAEQVAAGWFTPAFRRRDPATVAAFAAMVGRADPEGYAGCCEAIAGMDLRPMLPAVKAPVLVIAGSEDERTPPWHGATIASAIGTGGSRLRVVRGGAHLANVSHAAEVTSLILAHLSGQPR
jgi:3-oxoadipate enol-lactonase